MNSESHNLSVVAFFLNLSMQTLSNWFGALMVMLVISGAVAFTFSDFMIDRISGTRRTIFIFILLAYGVYRSIRLYQVFKHRNHEH